VEPTPERIAEIRAWAARLRDDSDVAETRAAARVILMLTQEVDRLRTAAPGESDASSAPRREPRRRLRDRFTTAPPLHEPDFLDEPDVEPEPPPEPKAAAAFENGWDEPTRSEGDPLEAPFDAEGESEPRNEPETRMAVTEEPLAPAPHDPDRGERRQDLRQRRSRGRRRLVLVLVAVAALTLGAFLAAARMAGPDLELRGAADGAKIGAAQAGKLSFSVQGDPSTLDDVRFRLDGKDVTGAARRRGNRMFLAARKLSDGGHEVEVSAGGGFLGAETSRKRTFTLDTRPPALTVPRRGVPKGKPVRLRGTVEDGASLAADGRRLEVDDGRYTLAYADMPRSPIRLVARDDFGNVTRRRLRLQVIPRRPPAPLRSVHVTAAAWSSPPLRKGILDLLDQRRINSVEIDLKDESGIVGFPADVPLGRRIGAVQEIYDLQEAVKMLHARGAWVVGRLVAFRDPIHATAAWKAGNRDQVVQTPDGSPYAGYGGFTNFANPVVRRYNIDVAKAAAEAGIDDILYDYIRRPDGPTSSMAFPGLKVTPERSMVAFLQESSRALKPYGVFVGASVFGVAATRPEEVAQDIPGMAREVDYIAPMLYPSHWGPGEYDVASPNSSPYDIVFRSLQDFRKQTKGTGARVVPWLQDFSLGVTYGPAEVEAQIRAARDAGMPEFLLWDPLVTYTAEALDPQARTTKRSSAAKRQPNELGVIPVIMYHQIREDGGGEFDLTPDEFRAELARLQREGYRPVRAVDLVAGRLNVPAGTTPVVLTFDDSTKEQVALTEDGNVAPNTALGIMLDFAREHPGFRPVGTFYPNREPFAGVAEGPELLRMLVERGFELGNHTDDHIPFSEKDAEGVQEALVRGRRIITDAVPKARVRTLALPLGAMPEPASLARAGTWDGERYRHDGVFLVGAEPASSPFSSAWDPHAIPRIRTGRWSGGEPDYGSGYWLELLRKKPGRRYVSDGDPSRISFPARLASKLAARYRARANPL